RAEDSTCLVLKLQHRQACQVHCAFCVVEYIRSFARIAANGTEAKSVIILERSRQCAEFECDGARLVRDGCTYGARLPLEALIIHHRDSAIDFAANPKEGDAEGNERTD